MPFRSLMNGAERIPMSKAYGKSSRSRVSLPLSKQGSALNLRRSWQPSLTCGLKPNSESAEQEATAARSKPQQTQNLNGERLDSPSLRRQLALQILRYAVLDGSNSFRVFLVEARRDFQRAKSLAFSVTSVAPACAASSAISRSRTWRPAPILPFQLPDSAGGVAPAGQRPQPQHRQRADPVY